MKEARILCSWLMVHVSEKSREFLTFLKIVTVEVKGGNVEGKCGVLLQFKNSVKMSTAQ